MFAIDLVELPRALSLPVVELHDRHSGDVLLKKCIDLGDRDAHPAIGIPRLPPKDGGCYENHGNDRQCDQSQFPIKDQDRHHNAE